VPPAKWVLVLWLKPRVDTKGMTLVKRMHVMSSTTRNTKMLPTKF
jgi:hypothetical protein